MSQNRSSDTRLEFAALIIISIYIGAAQYKAGIEIGHTVTAMDIFSKAVMHIPLVSVSPIGKSANLHFQIRSECEKQLRLSQGSYQRAAMRLNIPHEQFEGICEKIRARNIFSKAPMNIVNRYKR